MTGHEEKKTLYVGNYTIDIAVKEGVGFNEKTNSFSIETEDGKVEVREDSERIITTDKNDAEIDLTFLLNNVPQAIEKLGGGGRNSLDEAILMETTGKKCMYLDMQLPVEGVLDYMRDRGVEAYFLDKRKPAVNLVLGGREDKRILKSPIEKNKLLKREDKELIENLVKSCKRVMLNSLKDEALTKCLIRYAKKYEKDIGVVVTTSFDDYNFVQKKIIPEATCIFNYDEIGTVFNPEHKSLGDENDKFFDALWGIGDAIKLQRSLGNGGYSLYVTLGKNGVLAADKNGDVCHIYLENEKIKERIAKKILEREDATNGAGDHFAAAVLKYEEEGAGTIFAALRAQIRAIRFIGYEGKIGVGDFWVRPIDEEKLERKFILRAA